MTTRRAFVAAALAAAPLSLGAARHSAAFRLEPADGQTEALLAARAEACTADGLHRQLQDKLAAALEAAARDGTPAETSLMEALSRCPLCGCGLAPLAPDQERAPGF